jgi:hypothetical protein
VIEALAAAVLLSYLWREFVEAAFRERAMLASALSAAVVLATGWLSILCLADPHVLLAAGAGAVLAGLAR